MAARGTESKTVVFNKLQEVFPNAFWEDPNKILRIPLVENGSSIEIKVTLTAAKNILGDGGVPSAFDTSTSDKPAAEPAPAPLSEEEKENVAKMLAALNL